MPRSSVLCETRWEHSLADHQSSGFVEYRIGIIHYLVIRLTPSTVDISTMYVVAMKILERHGPLDTDPRASTCGAVYARPKVHLAQICQCSRIKKLQDAVLDVCCLPCARTS